MAGEFNSFFRLQNFYVLFIERVAKRVAMRRLPPLWMSIRVTGSASFCRNEHFFPHERARGSRCIAGRKRIRTEFEVIGFGDLDGIRIFLAVIVRICRNLPASHEYGHGEAEENETCESGYRSVASQGGGLQVIFLGGEHLDCFMSSPDVPEKQMGENYKQTGPFKYQRVPMPVNILGWIQISTFRLRSRGTLKFVI